MDKLKESIKNPTWSLLYLGVQYNLLSPREAMELVDNNLLEKLDENQIGILYSLEGKSSFLSTLEELNLYHQTDLNAAKNEWEAIVLRNIRHSDLSDEAKLKALASVWPLFGYPESWRHFIYYIPSTVSNENGIDGLYNNFLNFVERHDS